MKKLVSLICVAVMLFALASCGGGKSVPVSIVAQNNKTGALLSGGTVAYTEKIEYFSQGLSYEIYYELSSNFSYLYNVTETIGDYAMYAANGNVYTEKGGEICAVLFANPTVTFPKFANEYIDVPFPLDSGKRYQRSSETDGEYTVVTYYAEITPQMASEIYSVDLEAGDTLVSVFKIGDKYRVFQIDYSVEHADGSPKTDVARHTFTYFTERQNVFASLPDENGESATVILDFGSRTTTFTVPLGVLVGFDDGGAGYEYFTDASMTSEYAPIPACDMTVYVKTNSD